MRRLLGFRPALGVILLLLSLSAPSIGAEKPDRISVAYCIDCVQFHFQNFNGQADGMIIDLWRLWSRKTGIEVEFKGASWEETLAMVGEGRADAHAGLFFNKERDKFLEYGSALAETDTRFFVHKNLPGIETVKDLAAYKVGVLSGDYVESFLKQQLPAENVVGFASYEKLMQALVAGKLQTFAADTPTAIFHLQKSGLGYVFHSPAKEPLYRSNWFVAATEGNRDLIKIVDAGMALITANERRDIERRWASISDPKIFDESAPEGQLTLSDEERKWLTQHPNIRVHNEMNWPPFNFNEDNRPKGFSIDYMNLLAASIGLTVEYVSGPSWDEFLDMMKTSKLDVMLNIVKTPERQKYLRYTKPYTFNPNTILSRRDAPYDNLEQLFGKTISVPKGFFYEEILKRDFPKIKLLLVKDTEESIKAVAFGRADAALGELAVFGYLLNRNMITDLVLSGEVKLGGSNYTQLQIAVRKDLKILASILVKAMRALDEDKVDALRRRWINASAKPDTEQRRELRLTGDEREWLDRHKNIRLGVDPLYPPFEFVDEKGRYAGIASDYVRLISERLSVNMRFVPGLSWQQVVAGIGDGSIDVLPAVMATNEREAIMDFVRPHMTFPVVVITRDDFPLIAGVGDLVGNRVALVRDYAVSERVRTDYPNIQHQLVDTPLDALREVAVGNAEAAIMNLAVGTYLIRAHALANLKVAAPADFDVPGLSFGVRKDWPELVGILDKAIASIGPEEESAIRAKWAAVQYDKGIDVELALQIGAAVALILVVIVIWNRMLKREVEQRKLAESIMETAKDEAERITQAKTDFIAVVSHEVRTPMNGVLGMAKLLTETKMDAEQRKCVETIVASGEALLTIIDDLLDISKLDADKLEIENLPFIAGDVVQQSVALMKTRADEKGLTLESSIDPNLPSVMIGDAHRLRQIVLNLLSNAVKFTETGSVTLDANLVSRNTDTAVLTFTVADTGKGISSGEIEKLFIAYDQGSVDVARKYGGTGLGLSICRRLATNMGGDITVTSTVGEGSAFTFKARFPIDTVTDPAVLRREMTPPRPIDADKRTIRPLSVLQAEDNATNRAVIELALTRVGHVVTSVENGADAVEALKSGEFDVVLMDRHMPVMDGLTATRHIRGLDGPKASIAIIGVTAGASQSEIDACLSSGMDNCFVKPLDAEKLRAALDNLDLGDGLSPAANGRHADQSDPTAPANSAQEEAAPIDLAKLGRILGNDDKAILISMLQLFNTEFPKLYSALQASVTERDSEAVRKCAHSSKGAAANAAAATLSALLLEIEQNAHLGNWDDIEAHTGAIAVEFDRVLEFCARLEL